jgi:WD40 repeat protein/tRNA A-37 threonylcarbamoyl transferase component Bud32
LLEPLPINSGPDTSVVSPFGRYHKSPAADLTASLPRVRGYELLSLIGSGGMGVVYKARHVGLRRIVALKMLRGAALNEPEFVERFHVEAKAIARLQHPNIIQVFELGATEPQPGEDEPSPFIALELVDGGNLGQQTGKPLSPQYAAQIVEKLARAADSAHRLGVVHRDLKPGNVLLTYDGEPKIADFGLAKQLGHGPDAADHFVTITGMVVGTPEYMAPEQASGDPPTAAVDVYALGTILYEMLTGRVPFQGATSMETMELVIRQEPVPPRRLQPGLSRDLETICLKCLEKSPGNRFESAVALAEDLRRWLDGSSILARRASEIEKFGRWCRRNPLAAGSLGMVAATLLLAFVLISFSYLRADEARHGEFVQRQAAERKEKAERWERYRANLAAAGNAFQVHNVSGARRMLEAAPPEYRNWEWLYYNSRLDLAASVQRFTTEPANSGGFCEGGQRLLLSAGNRWIVWDMHSERQLLAIGPELGIHGKLLSNDGRLLACSIPAKHAIVLKDVDTNEDLMTLRGFEGEAQELQFSADATRLSACFADNSVRVWDTRTGSLIRSLGPQGAGYFNAHLSPDGRLLLIWNLRDRVPYVWDVDTDKRLAILPEAAQDAQLAVRFGRKADRAVTVSAFPSNELHLWELRTGKLLGVMRGHTNTVTSVAISSDGACIASSSRDQTVWLWSGDNGRAIAKLKGHLGPIHNVRFSPDGKRLVSTSDDQTVRVWDATTGETLGVLFGHAGPVHDATYTADMQTIVSASVDGTIRLWESFDAERNGSLLGHTSFVYGVAFHPNGKQVATASWDGTARIWDARTGRQTLLLDHGRRKIVTFVAFHPSGSMLATRARDGVRLWDAGTGQLTHTWKVSSAGWHDTRLAFSPRGDRLAAGCVNREIRVWNPINREEVAILRGHRGEIRELAFSPDGKLLASASADDAFPVRIWDVERNLEIRAIPAHTHLVRALAFSADGQRLASGSDDSTVRIWDTRTWQQLAALEHGTSVYGVTFSPDGARLACACADSSIRFWDMLTYQEVVELRGHDSYVYHLAFSPDGSRLASASGDGTARIWTGRRSKRE